MLGTGFIVDLNGKLILLDTTAAMARTSKQEDNTQRFTKRKPTPDRRLSRNRDDAGRRRGTGTGTRELPALVGWLKNSFNTHSAGMIEETGERDAECHDGHNARGDS